MPQGVVKPANQIIAAGDPLVIEGEVGANATAAKMIPGRIVIFDSTQIKPGRNLELKQKAKSVS